jgi:NAD(P)-dependent dehydrogenase (short-subunit alcohol dehydrogenase family)
MSWEIRMVVLITGCSSGFGLQTALMAAEAGHVVYAGLRELDEPGGLVAKTDEMEIHPVQLNITSEAERNAVIERILSEQGRLDALVNNAGVVLGGYMEQIDDDELRNIFEVNVFGTWSLTSRALPALRESGGIVVTITSISGLRGFPGLGAYAASKFALEGMFESLSQEVKPMGVRVSLVEPGTYDTRIWQDNRAVSRNTFDKEGPYAAYIGNLEASFDANATQSPGDPREVSSYIVGLLENEKPPLRRILWGSRRTRVLFSRVHGRMAYKLPEDV